MEKRRQCTLEGRGVTFNDRLALTVRQGLDLLDRTFPIEWITINRLKLNDFVSFWSNVLPRTRKCQTWRKCTLQHNYTAAVADIHRQPLLFMNESRLAQTALRLFRVCSWKFSESHSSMHHKESSASPGPINCCLLVAATSTTRCPVVSLRLPQNISTTAAESHEKAWEADCLIRKRYLRSKHSRYELKRQNMILNVNNHHSQVNSRLYDAVKW